MLKTSRKNISPFIVLITVIQLIMPLIVIADHSMSDHEDIQETIEEENQEDELNNNEIDEPVDSDDSNDAEMLEELEEFEDVENSESLDDLENSMSSETELEVNNKLEDSEEKELFKKVKPTKEFKKNSLDKEMLTTDVKKIEGLLPGEVSHKAEISKSIELENTWNLDIELKSRKIITEETIDIVFVIERSKYLENNKEKIKELFETLLTENIGLRIALVSYAGPSEDMLTIEHEFSRELESLNLRIDKIRAEEGSNIQAGLLQGYRLLESSSADKKHLFLISEGMPTYSYETSNCPKFTSAAEYESERAEVYNGYFDEERVVGDGLDVDWRYEVAEDEYLYVNHADAALRLADVVRENIDSLLTFNLDLKDDTSVFLENLSSNNKLSSFDDDRDVTKKISSESLFSPGMKDVKLIGKVNEKFEILEESIMINQRDVKLSDSQEGDVEEFAWNIPMENTQMEEIQGATISYQVELSKKSEVEKSSEVLMSELFLEYVDVDGAKRKLEIESPEVKLETVRTMMASNSKNSDFEDDRTYEDYGGKYTLQDILKNYVVFSFGNVVSHNIHGDVAIARNLSSSVGSGSFYNNKIAGETYLDTLIPSFVQGKIQKFRVNDIDLIKSQYVGRKNVISKENNKYKINNNEFFSTNNTSVHLFYSDNFINWEKAKKNIVNDSEKIIDSSERKITKDDILISDDPHYKEKKYIEISENENISIPVSLLNELDILVLKLKTDANGESSSTVINITNELNEKLENVELPDVFYQKLTFGNAIIRENIKKNKNLIWNVSNNQIKNVRTKCEGWGETCSGSGAEGFGHLIAPNAHFESTKGQYYGNVIVKSMESRSTHHYLNSDIPDLTPKPEQVLPQTGGIGDLIYIIVGSIFILSSAYFYKKQIIIE